MNSANDSASFWENHYAGMDAQWGTTPNVVLADLVADLAPTPATALDLGCGHGGDALWLAVRGWDVTAVDVSRTALDRVVAGAAATGVADRVRAERHDLAATFPDGTYALVAATYFHTPVTIAREDVLRRAARAVAPGGLLAVIEHASAAPWSWQTGQDVRFPTPDEVIASLRLTNDWHVERGEAPQRTATGPDGRTATVTDNVIALRRGGWSTERTAEERGGGARAESAGIGCAGTAESAHWRA
ncbi:bifunctional 2-polyprenyl-6-hydroxyphenol methylase/3-demethylubiquinol 3-O-methyltransferase UbiG [Nocardiopsis sp. YSL2]|uniref:class I SAM-dependent methyltransferase n=1 Tax=Nocardiopsis sp. YSL2 TaxID=2939492 RepID=UPI0026F417ED|nr:class I SAM-dependent methyltransferase [Nocardiopsis sp. YSL2]